MTTPNQPLQPLQNDPFSGIEGVKDATTISPADRLKIAILGKPKSGKSWFAATAPKPVLVYDFDDRAESLAGKDGVFVKTLVDTNVKNPTSVAELEKDVSMFQYKKAKGAEIPKSFVFDSMTFFLNCIKNEYHKNNTKDGRFIRIGGTMVQIGMSWDWINTGLRFIDYIITEYSSLGNVILVFHERDEKDYAESTSTDIRYTGMITVNPQFLAPVLSKVNEVFRISVNNDRGTVKYNVECKPTDEMLASTSLLIDAIEPPDLMQMIAKHNLNKTKKP